MSTQPAAINHPEATIHPAASINPANIKIRDPTPAINPVVVSALGNTNNSLGHQSATPTSCVLAKAQPLPPETFPNLTRPGNSQVPPTIPNVQYLLARYGIIVRYNVIRKKLSISVPGYSGAPDNSDSVALSMITSLAILNNMATGPLANFVEVVGDQQQYNPVADWITSRPWDGTDRLGPFCDTLVADSAFPEGLKRALIHRWLISAAAAALKPDTFRSRGVLTLQGPQSIGKTAWVSALVPDPILREGVVKLDHHLDLGNKDTLLTAVCHWVVEIGELDSSFKKDVARLKGFLTGDRDKIRRPYGRVDSEYPRRTVFCATVNDHDFLVDMTGNTRWWTIPVTSINFRHAIDMQQVFAQVAVDYENEEPWWLTMEEEAQLENCNEDHRRINAIEERVLAAIDVAPVTEGGLPAMTPTELLQAIGIANPSNTQAKECAAVLRRLFGNPKKIRGLNKWRVRLTGSFAPPSFRGKSEEDLY